MINLDTTLTNALDALRLQGNLDDVLEHMTHEQRAEFLRTVVAQVIATFTFIDNGRHLATVAACVGAAVTA